MFLAWICLRKLQLSGAVLALCLVFGGTLIAHAAISNGENASDALGQYDGNVADPSPVYTKGTLNNVANPLGLNTPTGVVIDAVHHYLFLSDSLNNRVLVYTLTSSNQISSHIPTYVLGQPNLYSNTAATTQGGLSFPQGLTVDTGHNRLFVGDRGNNRVLVFNTTVLSTGMNADYVLGQSSFTTASAATTQVGMSLPINVFYDTTRDRLFVGDFSNHRVLVFSGASLSNGMSANTVLGQSNFTTATPATTQSGLSNPAGLAYDSTRNRLYVGDYSNNRVIVFSGASLSTGMNANTVLGQTSFTASTAATTQAGFKNPVGIAYDGIRDRLFVSEETSRRILVFSGASLRNAMSGNTVLGQSSFTAASAATTQSGISSPGGMAYDTTSKYLVATDYGNHRVLVFNTDALSNGMNASDAFGQYDDNASNPGPIYTKGAANNVPNQYGFNLPRAAVLDRANHHLFVSDSTNNRVLVYTLTDANRVSSHLPSYVLGQPNFYTRTAATSQTGMSVPINLAYDAVRNRLFVNDLGNNRVIVFSGASLSNAMRANTVLGQSTFTTATAATTQTGASTPTGLVYDSVRNRLYVGDLGNNRVLVFSGASLTNGMKANTVLGQSSFTAASPATTQAGLNGPTGMTYDTTRSRFFVSDNTNNRILVFSGASLSNGMTANTVLGQTTFTAASAATTQSGLSGPGGLEYDAANSRLFAAENTNNRVLVFNASRLSTGMNAMYVLGQVDFTHGGAATTQAGMRFAFGVNYDNTTGNLFFGDMINNRILVFDAAPLTPTITFSVSNNGLAAITLNDADLNTTAGTDTVSMTLTTSGGDSETVTLTETSASSGIFAGAIQLGYTQRQVSNGILDDNSQATIQTTASYTNVYGNAVSFAAASLSPSITSTATVQDMSTSISGGGRRTNTTTASSSSSATSEEPSPTEDVPAAPSPLPADDSSSLHVMVNGQDVILHDVPYTAWFAPFVQALVERGIISGYKDSQGNPLGLFKPGNSVTYAEAAKMILLAAGKTIGHGDPLNPSAKNDWSAPYVWTAESLHLSPYITSPTVQDPMSRGAVIQAWLEALGVQMTSGQSNPFSDLSSSHRYAKALFTAYQLGIISGDTDAAGQPLWTVRPDDTINRAELAKILTIMPDLSVLPTPGTAESTVDQEEGTHIIAPLVNLRTDARVTATILRRLHQGDSVTILRRVDLWAEVELSDGTKGFVIRRSIGQ